jgi:hypothetical protein
LGCSFSTSRVWAWSPHSAADRHHHHAGSLGRLIAALFVIGEGLTRTGIACRLSDHLISMAGNSESRLLTLLMLAVAALGSVMSSTGVVAIFIPVSRLINSRGCTRSLFVNVALTVLPWCVAGPGSSGGIRKASSARFGGNIKTRNGSGRGRRLPQLLRALVDARGELRGGLDE